MLDVREISEKYFIEEFILKSQSLIVLSSEHVAKRFRSVWEMLIPVIGALWAL